MDTIEQKIQLLINNKTEPPRPPIIINHADKVVIEKLEHSNNFGSLQIQDLGGRLNIGVNYSGFMPQDQLEALFKEIPKKETTPQPENASSRPAPRYNLRPKDGL